MTIDEFILALDGYLESKGLKKPQDRFMSRNDLLELAAKYDNRN